MPDRAVVELRIHGVGGSTPEGLLGERHPDDVVRLRQGHRTGLWARRAEPGVQGYVWGGLTAGSRLQPLWVMLLPFTLLNVAGWMHPPVTGRARRRRQVKAVRLLVTALGWTLTATWTVWLAVIVADYLAFQAGGGRDPAHPVTVALLAGAGAVLVGAGLLWRGWLPLLALGGTALVAAAALHWADVPRVRAVGGVAGALVLLGGLALVAETTRRPFAAEQRSRLGARWATRRNDDLRNPSFFTEFRGSGRHLAVHVGVAAATAVVLAVRAWDRAGAEPVPASLGFGSGVVALGALQLLLVLALAGVSLGTGAERGRHWRYAGPAVAATMALALTAFLFGGVALFVSRQIGGTVTGAELALVDVLALNLAAAGTFAALVWIPWVLGAGRSGGPEGRRRRRERLAAAPRHLDLVCTVGSAVLVVAGCWATLSRVRTMGSALPWNWEVAATASIGPFRDLAVWLLLLVVPGVGLAVRAGARSARTRRRIGNVWDVLTFWPRRFHPLAVRPYTEHAVPELQEIVRDHLRAPDRAMVVSAHSQGSVLAFAALSPLVAEEDWGDRLALVTYGSPLGRLHATFFPAYMGPPEFAFLSRNLAEWRNFYRRTDHIGQEVLAPAAGDELLADPAGGGPPDLLPPPGARGGLEPDRPPGNELAGHNDYLNEPRVKAWVAATRSRLAAGATGPGPGVSPAVPTSGGPPPPPSPR